MGFAQILLNYHISQSFRVGRQDISSGSALKMQKSEITKKMISLTRLSQVFGKKNFAPMGQPEDISGAPPGDKSCP